MITEFHKEGFVSVWFGKFTTLEDLMDYTDFVFDEDGEAYGEFASDSGLEWFDHDFQEANFLGPLFDSRASLYLHSYSSSFIDTVASALEDARQAEDNSLFLLYDCAYDPTLVDIRPICRLRYVGYFPYTKGAPRMKEIEDESH